MQSVSKAFTYAISLNDLGADEVHKYIGTEPSGRFFNEICLDYNSMGEGGYSGSLLHRQTAQSDDQRRRNSVRIAAAESGK
jgi:hypothetical protein